MSATWKSPSFLLALSLHIVLLSLLLFTFEKTIRLPAQMPQEQKPIIDAVMVNNDAVKKEVERLDRIEKAKVDREKARLREIARKEKEAVEKRQKEEALAIELKQKNEALKKEAEKQRIEAEKQKIEAEKQKIEAEKQRIEAEKQKIAKEKKIKEEKERLAKEKQRHEEELKKIEKQKEEALAQKKKIEDERKAAEESARQQANLKIKLDQIMQHAMLIKSKVIRNWRQPLGFDIAGYKCDLDVKLLPTGEVVQVIVIRSSGNLEFDRSAELALYKSSPLPMPNDQELAKEFRQFSFTFNPGVA